MKKTISLVIGIMASIGAPAQTTPEQNKNLDQVCNNWMKKTVGTFSFDYGVEGSEPKTETATASNIATKYYTGLCKCYEFIALSEVL
jgi:hypothetical protein